jgi:hypothetical protein
MKTADPAAIRTFEGRARPLVFTANIRLGQVFAAPMKSATRKRVKMNHAPDLVPDVIPVTLKIA